MRVRDFKIAIPESALADLRDRLHRARWPNTIAESSWEDGASLPFLKRLREYWLDGFDWRQQEARLNQIPQYMASIGNHDIHFVHVRGAGPAPLPLVFTHGWPGSFLEAEHLLPLLADPAGHGGASVDAFDVVVPSLPGYGFSTPPESAGIGAREVAELWKELMNGLGYARFAAQGGDIGASVSAWLARLYPKALNGIHLNFIPGSFRPPLGPTAASITSAEQAFLDERAEWAAREGAYGMLHATKPQTLALSLTDSPIGLASWIVEKFHSWSDCNGEIESVFSLDHLLTNISLYWFSGNVWATLRLYKENLARPLTFEIGERISVPMGFAHFPKELPTPPRSWAERVFDIRQWNSMPAGGHFAALEQPELLAREVRSFFRPLRVPTH